MSLLSGKAVVITGSGQGLGRAFAHHAAAQGAAVVVNDVDADLAHEVAGEIRALGGRAVPHGGSVADAGQAAGLIDQCVAEFGALDGLVNNAGVNYRADPWDDDAVRMREVVEVNVLGPLYCGTAAAKVMRDQGGGVIVNVGSGSMIGQRRAAAYSASKGAVASMTASWAADLTAHGIRVNAVAPVAWTRMAQHDPNVVQTPQHSPDRVAPLVTYLLSDLSAGLTGQILRFRGDILCVLRQTAIKDPVLEREAWTVEDIAEAIDGDLRAALEPPPPARWK
ncbi:SDR family NAD(P)-dependent oxidoreductase [Amycolatopsis regifaucium]|uniref:Short-chain dehydrogenase n=1 Tax=Amycolatopsis regifaucium TaxID=546365 RepID=A0A154MSH5_9PSEU|nr:SDR family oxidoreductase [Amycolatopsis regifaucium]KZB87274.1 short-chain dehydrogenase [Amycolatopsis regifaucium]OKA08108.1 short-chain dehydrogenase [Amycolatopsis regifaucium]SFI39885.1 Short-chain dehydrogenase [Amycolatopsis regifaucium]